MGWSRPDEDSRADYVRDLRKAWVDPQNGPTPLRFEPLCSTAMDVALVVRGMTNLMEAGKLIDAYADAKAAAERLDAVRAGCGR